jgi:hypothetical protein
MQLYPSDLPQVLESNLPISYRGHRSLLPEWCNRPCLWAFSDLLPLIQPILAKETNSDVIAFIKHTLSLAVASARGRSVHQSSFGPHPHPTIKADQRWRRRQEPHARNFDGQCQVRRGSARKGLPGARQSPEQCPSDLCNRIVSLLESDRTTAISLLRDVISSRLLVQILSTPSWPSHLIELTKIFGLFSVCALRPRSTCNRKWVTVRSLLDYPINLRRERKLYYRVFPSLLSFLSDGRVTGKSLSMSEKHTSS